MPQITVDMNNAAYKRVQEIAKRAGKTVEGLLSDWLNGTGLKPPMELFSNEEILEIADVMLPQHQQEELNRLLALNSEGQINEKQRLRLDELMDIYNELLVRKAEAIAIAVERGLREPLAY